MTMHKVRVPGTFSHAITATCEDVGFKVAADAVGKSESLLRRWADPDDDPLPRVDQALLLDKAWTEEHEGEPPILQMWRRSVHPTDAPKGECVRAALFDFTTASAWLHLALDEATAPTSPGGHKITQKEGADVLTLLDASRKELDEIEALVKSSTPALRAVDEDAA